MTFRKQVKELEEAQKQELLAFREQQRAETKALFQRQLEKQLELIRSNPEGVLESALAAIKEKFELDWKGQV